MGLRYRKSVKVLPGVKLNISKSGISTSVGKPGSTVNFSSRGTKATVGIPGSGLSYSTMVGKRKNGSGQRRPSARSLDNSRADMMQQYGFTESEMRRFEKKVKRNPKKFRKMSEEELVAYVRRSRMSPRTKKILIVIFVILIVLALIKSIAGK